MKMISEKWEGITNLAKEILGYCSKFNYSVSVEFIAYLCDMDITSEEWRKALIECYENDLLTPIILNHPRLKMNNIIRTLILAKETEQEGKKEYFLEKIGQYYVKLAANIGECYNAIYKLNRMDEYDEYSLVLEILNILYENHRYREYIDIIRELKYYIYVRGKWEIGEEAIHLKRAKAAQKVQDKNNEVEAFCDYINSMSKSKNKEEAKKYLEETKQIIQQNETVLSKRILCLFHHVTGLYLYNCEEKYQKAYEEWKYNKQHYFQDINEYRRCVNDLWETRCLIKLETDKEKVIQELKRKIEEMKNINFTRAEIDYELLLVEQLFKEYGVTKKNEYIKEAEKHLENCQILLESKSNKDIRNEANYFRLQALLATYKAIDATEYIEKANENYKLMNCYKDIEILKEEINKILEL